MPNPLFCDLFGRHVGNLSPFLILQNEDTISYDAFLRLSGQMANALTAGLPSKKWSSLK